VASGYSGGRFPNPTYEQVCTGLTGHAEVVHLEFDPTEISYVRLLEVFWRTHDPTTLNRQGLDVGSQYRSAIFYHNDQQRDLAEQIKRRLNQEHAFRDPIVTEITKFENFYVAKGYHQDYFAKNGRQPYCRRIIRPKLAKFRRIFKEDLKRNSRATTSTK
jgi:peptide-methionine (S)-S-oxide reductase